MPEIENLTTETDSDVKVVATPSRRRKKETPVEPEAAAAPVPEDAPVQEAEEGPEDTEGVSPEAESLTEHDRRAVEELEAEMPEDAETSEDDAPGILDATGNDEVSENSITTEQEKEIADGEASMFGKSKPSGKTGKKNPSLRREQEKVQDQIAKADHGENISELKGITRATREEKREFYSDNGIIPLGDELGFKSEGQRRRSAYISLVGSMKSNQPLTGKIFSTTTEGNYLCAVIQYDGFRVLIPSEKLLSKREENAIANTPDEGEKTRMRRRFTMQRIGADIDFIVTGIDEKEMVATGDRHKAMDIKRQAWYLSHNQDGELALNKGARAEARVVMANRSMMIVEVFGIEYALREHDIAYVQIPNIAEEYPVGSTVPVIFTKLERERTDQGIVIRSQVSVKEAMQDPRKRAFDAVHDKDYVSATVTGLTENGIIVRLGGMNGKQDCLCQYQRATPAPGRSPEIPEIGRNCIIRIRKKDEFDSKDNPIYRIYGDIIRLL